VKKFVFIFLILISSSIITYNDYKREEITSVLAIKQKNGSTLQVKIKHQRSEKRFSPEEWELIGKGNNIYFYEEK
jgi:hypothetical protein